MKKLLLFVILIVLSVSLFADPNEDLHNGDESVIPTAEIQCENIWKNCCYIFEFNSWKIFDLLKNKSKIKDKEVKNMELSIKVEHIGNTLKDFSEKTFCFRCGCFQGGGLELTP